VGHIGRASARPTPERYQSNILARPPPPDGATAPVGRGPRSPVESSAYSTSPDPPEQYSHAARQRTHNAASPGGPCLSGPEKCDHHAKFPHRDRSDPRRNAPLTRFAHSAACFAIHTAPAPTSGALLVTAAVDLDTNGAAAPVGRGPPDPPERYSHAAHQRNHNAASPGGRCLSAPKRLPQPHSTPRHKTNPSIRAFAARI
jgi:hypothetical protein